MGIKMVGKCKNCGAEVKVNEDQEKAFCPYCGAEFVIEEGGGAIGSITSMINKIDKRHTEAKEAEKIRADIRGREKREAGAKFFPIMLAVCLGGLFLMYFMSKFGL